MTGDGFVVHGVTLGLAWFTAANALLSIAAIALVAAASRAARPAAAGWWLALRLMPAGGSALFVAVLFVPSYVRFEPRETVEGVDRTLAAFALAAAALLAFAAVRAVAAWRRAERQAAVWARGARPLASPSGLPAYAIGAATTPLMALVGIARPRVFVSDRLVDALTADELGATLAHEASHATAADNLKRLAMRAAPDFLGLTAAASAIERRWAAAAEHAADRVGAGIDPAARCALASALVKAARLTPRSPATLEPISTLVGGGDITARVQQLLGDPQPRAAWRPRLAFAVTVAAIGAGALAFAPLLHAVHAATEVLVNSLP